MVYIQDENLRKKYGKTMKIGLYDPLNQTTPECFANNMTDILNGVKKADFVGGRGQSETS